MKKLIAIGLTLSLPLSAAYAQSSPYSYGGACGMQGSWTQQALKRTNELKSFIQQIKDDPNCKALPETLQKTFAAINDQVATARNSDAEGEPASLPREIGALRSFLSATPDFKTQVMSMITGKLVRQSVVNSSTPVVQSPSEIQRVKDLVNLRARAKRAFNDSLTLVNQTIDTLPQVERCLSGDGNNFGHFLASTIQLVGSFVGSGQGDTGSNIATTVSKLANFVREVKYQKALAKLDQNEYVAALSCILEVTEEGYCAARDAKIVFDEMMDNQQLVQDSNGELSLAPLPAVNSFGQESHPLEGYYILSQNLPIVTNWLQSVQLGVEPRMPTDSEQKNKPLDEINQFFKSVNMLKGTYNSNLETLRELKTLDEKKNLVVKMINSLADSMGSGRPDSTNFFTMAYQPMHIPFRLLGMETPKEVLGAGGGFQQSPEDWLQANYEKIGSFNDPEQLAQSIGQNMDTIIKSANESALTYYNKWFIIDKVAIVNRSIVGHLYNVKESLSEMDTYLEHLQERIRKYSKDQSMIPGVIDTRQRIKKVLVKFDALEQLGHIEGDVNSLSSAKILAGAEDLMKEVYDQFYVMLAKSGWLANRMIDFIQYDYNLMQRANLNMSAYSQQIYLATGRAMVDQIISMSGSSPTAVNQDLAMALRLNKGNLEALEMALSNSYVDQIAVLKLITMGVKTNSAGARYYVKHIDDYQFIDEAIPGENNNKAWRITKGVWRNVLGGIGNFKKLYDQSKVVGSEVYGLFTPADRLSPDDEFGSVKKVLGQICVQTLGFNNLKPFWPLCRGSQVLSPFQKSYNVSDSLKETLNVDYVKKAWEKFDENRGLNHSLRICAMRDFNRKNLVLYLLQGQSRK